MIFIDKPSSNMHYSTKLGSFITLPTAPKRLIHEKHTKKELEIEIWVILHSGGGSTPLHSPSLSLQSKWVLKFRYVKFRQVGIRHTRSIAS